MNYLALGITNTVNYQTQKPLSEQADLEMAPDSRPPYIAAKSVHAFTAP